MNRQELVSMIRQRKSFLCVGLDPDMRRIPTHLLSSSDPVFEFNKIIIDATQDLCVAYKPNTAFYEALGLPGWNSFRKTIAYLRSINKHFIIADAKRGDIGNTSDRYAGAFFSDLNCDALTVAPYMGADSVLPFLNHAPKWTILLALTSNTGSSDFQQLVLQDGRPLWQHTLSTAAKWGSPDNLMFVVGATHPESFVEIRKIVPKHFLLVPGVGAQGGSLAEVAKSGMNADVGLLVNSSRGIIYAGGDTPDFAEASRAAAKTLQAQMASLI